MRIKKHSDNFLSIPVSNKDVCLSGLSSSVKLKPDLVTTGTEERRERRETNWLSSHRMKIYFCSLIAIKRLRPYHVENTSSRLITEVKQH